MIKPLIVIPFLLMSCVSFAKAEFPVLVDKCPDYQSLVPQDVPEKKQCTGDLCLKVKPAQPSSCTSHIPDPHQRVEKAHRLSLTDPNFSAFNSDNGGGSLGLEWGLY